MRKLRERWRPILDTKYEVSDLGRVRHRKHRRILKPLLSRGSRRGKGSLRATVKIHGNKQFVHRLVAKAFIPNPENKPEVNHQDGIPVHNKASNLEWATQIENMAHAVANDLTGFGRRNNNAKLSDEDVEFLRADYIKGDRPYLYEYAEVFGVHKSVICKAIKGDTWARVKPGDREEVRHSRIRRRKI